MKSLTIELMWVRRELAGFTIYVLCVRFNTHA